MENVDNFKVIELHMLHKSLFFPLSGMGSFSVHILVYPFTLVRTRLQLQEGNMVYRGLLHASRMIVKEEGVRGLYSGFFVKSIQLISGMAYIGTYEGIRLKLSTLDLSSSLRSFIGGGCASIVGQTMVVPVDIVSQHLMVLNKKASDSTKRLTPLRLSTTELESPMKKTVSVVKKLYSNYGIRGFYQGYFISLATYVPNSALWWAFYHEYCELLSSYFLPQESPRLLVQVLSAPMAGITSSIIMNPVDIVRVRMQVENFSLKPTLQHLWRAEGLRFFKKGLTARIAQSSVFSFWIILFYEPVKWFCLKEQYREHYTW